MMEHNRTDQIQIARVLGIPIYVHFSGLVIFGLVVWTLSTGYFPAQHPDLSAASYWTKGLVASLLLFVSIVLHELGHAVVALRRGLRTRSITLFIFGGVAQLDGDPKDGRAEFWMAAAGPLVSLALAGLFYACAILPFAGPSARAVAKYLALINLTLALFNLVPAFPMDGGRLLRGALWGPLGKVRATWIASGAGTFFAFFLIFSGVFSLLRGDSFAGVWYILLGWLIKNGASAGFQQARLGETLRSVTVREAMMEGVATIPGSGSVAEAARGRLMRAGHRSYPVTRGDSVVGLIFRKDVSRLSAEERESTSVQGAMRPLTAAMVIDPEARLQAAIAKMAQARMPRLLVVEGDRLLGLLTMNGMMRRLRGGVAHSERDGDSMSAIEGVLEKGIPSPAPGARRSSTHTMDALVYHGAGQRAWEERPRPKLRQATDAIVRVTTTTICGTDLHILKGDLPGVTEGRILGHEGVGIVEDVGAGVSAVREGDKVLISCVTSCAKCDFCRKGMYSHCRSGGWILGNTIDGTQAEYVRIPHADTSLYALPLDADDEAMVMLSDILPTGFECGVLNGQVKPGDTVAIVGAGPIGLAALLTAQFYSPAKIVMIDMDENRLQVASSMGGTLAVNSTDGKAVEKVLALTGGAGVDVAIEAVGMPATFDICQAILAPGGRLANVGVHGKPVELHLEKLWDRNITLTTRLVDTVTTPMLLKVVQSGRLQPKKLVTHRFALGDVMTAYDTFGNAAKERALKVILQRA